ncbi:MAG: hypothetical protein JSW56_16915 [Deltaproteobacteria bacterium]|jgi:adenylate kinase|nr:MAG: hypothetical protein JSW56_16915 [Deltaproteobacteria bacterium]
MATVKQIQYRLGQAKKKLAKLNREVAGAKNNIKKLEGQLKNARVAAKKKPKKKKAAPKRKKAAKKKAAPKRKKAAKKKVTRRKKKR